MKTLSRIIIALGFICASYSAVYCQDVQVSVAYGRTDFPKYGVKNEVENVNSIVADANLKAFEFSKKGRVGVVYRFDRKFNQEVYPDYALVPPNQINVNNPEMNFIDLYRDVDTHSVGVEVDYSIFFAALLYGFRKLHEDTPYQLIRTVGLGVKVPIGTKVFFKGTLNFEQPYGTLPMGFVNPYNRTLTFGLGYRFGKKSYSHSPLPTQKVLPFASAKRDSIR
jgi:hypothetical protein